MRRRPRGLVALVGITVLVGAPASYGQSPGPPNRPQLDSELARATDVGQLLQAANRYADAGYQQEAKAIVDRAAQKARSTTDWQSIAAAYLRLGYTDSANVAQRKARDVSR
jgi:Tfp pilus assembly protein PilF